MLYFWNCQNGVHQNKKKSPFEFIAPTQFSSNFSPGKDPHVCVCVCPLSMSNNKTDCTTITAQVGEQCVCLTCVQNMWIRWCEVFWGRWVWLAIRLLMSLTVHHTNKKKHTSCVIIWFLCLNIKPNSKGYIHGMKWMIMDHNNHF